MSNVSATTTNDNVTHCSSKQENNNQSIHHHHHHHHPYTHHQNRCLHEKCSNYQIVAHHHPHPHKNQTSNSSDSPIKRSIENNSNAFSGSCRQLGDSVSSRMRLNHIVDPVISGGGLPGTANSGITAGTQCHCLNQQQQSSNYHPADNGQLKAATVATSQGESKALDTGASASPICPSVIKSECHNITNTTTYNNPNTQKGIKRPNESVEQQQQVCQTPVIISSAAPHPPPSPVGGCQVVSPSSGKIAEGTSSQKSPPVEDQVQNGEEDEEEGDFMDENETTFDYEPVLIEILNEKKLALSNSPDVIKFLAGFRELQQY